MIEESGSTTVGRCVFLARAGLGPLPVTVRQLPNGRSRWELFEKEISLSPIGIRMQRPHSQRQKQLLTQMLGKDPPGHPHIGLEALQSAADWHFLWHWQIPGPGPPHPHW